MNSPAPRFQRLRFFLSTGGLYIGTIGFISYIIGAAYFPKTPVLAQAPPMTVSVKMAALPKATSPAFIVLSGKPIRLTITRPHIDLPVDTGHYNESNGTWTLSDTRLQYADITAPANNYAGNTFIYGHATNSVLGPLAEHPPTAGSIAEVYTDNGHIFTYVFRSAHTFTPEDTTIFNYSGPPVLTVQTCTGSVSEWRTMYTFEFQKVTK